jgi:hypothetical protein
MQYQRCFLLRAKALGSGAMIRRLPDLLEYAEILHDKFEDSAFDSYAREMAREARIFMDAVTPVLVEKWEKWDA